VGWGGGTAAGSLLSPACKCLPSFQSLVQLSILLGSHLSSTAISSSHVFTQPFVCIVTAQWHLVFTSFVRLLDCKPLENNHSLLCSSLVACSTVTRRWLSSQFWFLQHTISNYFVLEAQFWRYHLVETINTYPTGFITSVEQGPTFCSLTFKAQSTYMVPVINHPSIPC
jgi:hypothetical protein